MGQKIEIRLSENEQTRLDKLLNKGIVNARVMRRAHVLNLSASGKSDAAIVVALGVSAITVYRTRKRYLEGGLDRALFDRARLGRR